MGDSYERTGGADISYYHFGGRRLAKRTSAGVSYLYADHGRSLCERHSTRPHQGGREQRTAVATFAREIGQARQPSQRALDVADIIMGIYASQHGQLLKRGFPAQYFHFMVRWGLRWEL